MKLGDVISTVATPIARVWGMDCIDEFTGQLKPESGCARRRDNLNRFGDSVYDFLWQTEEKENQ